MKFPHLFKVDFQANDMGFHDRLKTFTRLQISALVAEIFNFEKCVEYANERTDNVMHSTKYYTKYIERASQSIAKRAKSKNRMQIIESPRESDNIGVFRENLENSQKLFKGTLASAL